MDANVSRIHLDSAAVNALLEQLVNAGGKAKVLFADGQFRCEVAEAGLTVCVTALTVDAQGVDIVLRFGPGEAS
jgi:hypothetical protein